MIDSRDSFDLFIIYRTEYIANDTAAEVHPYAVGGAVTDLTLWWVTFSSRSLQT